MEKIKMKNHILEEIKQFAIKRLQQEYQYCGVASSDYSVMLNSGGEGENIIIKIDHKIDEA